MPPVRPVRAGSSIEDYCRACKVDRMHTVIAADAEGRAIRVVCGFCDSEHNYRGGPRTDVAPAPASGQTSVQSPASAPPTVTSFAPRAASTRPRDSARAMPIVTDRERRGPAIATGGSDVDLELLLRRVIREEAGVSAVVPADKWRGGTLVLRPGTPGLQEKSWPIETFFHKVVMIRNRLRNLEQHVNASDLPDDVKVKLQAYVSACYGSLTSFNVLFADEDDQFTGSAKD
jgi:hypothetical protein